MGGLRILNHLNVVIIMHRRFLEMLRLLNRICCFFFFLTYLIWHWFGWTFECALILIVILIVFKYYAALCDFG